MMNNFQAILFHTLQIIKFHSISAVRTSVLGVIMSHGEREWMVPG